MAFNISNLDYAQINHAVEAIKLEMKHDVNCKSILEGKECTSSPHRLAHQYIEMLPIFEAKAKDYEQDTKKEKKPIKQETSPKQTIPSSNFINNHNNTPTAQTKPNNFISMNAINHQNFSHPIPLQLVSNEANNIQNKPLYIQQTQSSDITTIDNNNVNNNGIFNNSFSSTNYQNNSTNSTNEQQDNLNGGPWMDINVTDSNNNHNGDNQQTDNSHSIMTTNSNTTTAKHTVYQSSTNNMSQFHLNPFNILKHFPLIPPNTSTQTPFHYNDHTFLTNESQIPSFISSTSCSNQSPSSTTTDTQFILDLQQPTTSASSNLNNSPFNTSTTIYANNSPSMTTNNIQQPMPSAIPNSNRLPLPLTIPPINISQSQQQNKSKKNRKRKHKQINSNDNINHKNKRQKCDNNDTTNNGKVDSIFEPKQDTEYYYADTPALKSKYPCKGKIRQNYTKLEFTHIGIIFKKNNQKSKQKFTRRNIVRCDACATPRNFTVDQRLKSHIYAAHRSDFTGTVFKCGIDGCQYEARDKFNLNSHKNNKHQR